MYVKQIEYLKFLFSSKNAHGIHSPFVFDFITKCLYSKPKTKHPKTSAVLKKSIFYFKIKSIKVIGNDSLKDDLKDQLPELNWEAKPSDLLYLDKPSLFKVKKLLVKNEIHKNSIVLINNLYTSRDHKSIWTQLYNKTKFNVSIDLYYCGLLFIRKQQVKQHFRIRI